MLRSFCLYLSPNQDSFFKASRSPFWMVLQTVFIYAHTPFVALDILEVTFMGFSSCFRLFFECFKLAGMSDIKACFRFLTGSLILDDLDPKSLVFQAGGSDA